MPPSSISASGSIRTWRADAATAAQWRRTSSVSTPRQATVMGRMRRLVVLLAVLARRVRQRHRRRPVAGAGAGHGRARLHAQPGPRAALHGPGTRLRIQKPGSGPDSLKLVASGKVDLGVLDIHDLAIAREAGTDVVAVGALVGKPLAALIAQPGRRAARATWRAAPSASPGCRRIRRSCARSSSTTAATSTSIKQVTIGFNAVSRLLTKRVDARARVLERRGRGAQAARPGRARVPRRGLRRAAVPGGGPDHVAGDAARAGARTSRAR